MSVSEVEEDFNNNNRKSAQLVKSGAGIELGLSSVLLGLVGLYIDSKLDTTPILFLVFFMMGVIGSGLSLYYRSRESYANEEARNNG